MGIFPAVAATSVVEVLPVTGKADKFFSPAEKEAIRQAVSAAEKTTSGEIATMIVDSSDSYREAAVLAATLLAAMAALLIAVVTRHTTVWSYLPLTITCYFPAVFLVSKLPQLLKPFISRRRYEEAVRSRSVRAFYEKGLYRTKDETGVLIFISVFEHKVWILGDRGINARIAPEVWQQLAGELSEGIGSGSGCAALCRVIGRCGELLADHFPKKQGDLNELSDAIITGSRS